MVKCEQFVEQPQDAVVSRGQNHVLRCVVQDRVGELQWLRDGFGFGPGDELEGFPRYRIQRNDHTGQLSQSINLCCIVYAVVILCYKMSVLIY